jgi:hypothetical protein
MSAKNLYISEENEPTWSMADEVAKRKHLSLSAYLTQLIEDDLEAPRLEMVLYCVLCANHPQMPGAISTAKFVVNGLSVCNEHLNIAKNSSDFHDANTKVLHDYIEKTRKIKAA